MPRHARVGLSINRWPRRFLAMSGLRFRQPANRAHTLPTRPPDIVNSTNFDDTFVEGGRLLRPPLALVGREACRGTPCSGLPFLCLNMHLKYVNLFPGYLNPPGELEPLDPPPRRYPAIHDFGRQLGLLNPLIFGLGTPVPDVSDVRPSVLCLRGLQSHLSCGRVLPRQMILHLPR